MKRSYHDSCSVSLNENMLYLLCFIVCSADGAHCAIFHAETQTPRIRIVKAAWASAFLGNDCRRDESTNSLTFLRRATWTKRVSHCEITPRDLVPHSPSEFCKIYTCTRVATTRGTNLSPTCSPSLTIFLTHDPRASVQFQPDLPVSSPFFPFSPFFSIDGQWKIEGGFIQFICFYRLTRVCCPVL